MDRIDQFAPLTLAGDDTIAARVDYQVCGQCGFRLMRVETTLIGGQQLVVKRCPICEQSENEHSRGLSVSLPAEDRLRFFESWLATHGFDRNTLECHYHLTIDHFFDNEN